MSIVMSASCANETHSSPRYPSSQRAPPRQRVAIGHTLHTVALSAPTALEKVPSGQIVGAADQDGQNPPAVHSTGAAERAGQKKPPWQIVGLGEPASQKKDRGHGSCDVLPSSVAGQ